MSIQAVAWALEQRIEDPAAKLVMLSLCNAHNGETGVCTPSKARIAHEASVSVETVTRKLKWLAEEGWIEIIPRFDASGRQTTSSYRIMWEGVTVTPRSVTGDMGEGVNCDTPLKRTVIRNRNNTVASVDATACDGDFEAMWKGFPKTGHPSKQKAFAAWKRLSKNDRAECATGAAAYARWHAKECERRKDMPALHLATFINQRRWEDIQPEAVEQPAEIDWYSRVRSYEVTSNWHRDLWGPAPGEPGCMVPRELLLSRIQAKGRAA